jgi:hypothetical protein
MRKRWFEEYIANVIPNCFFIARRSSLPSLAPERATTTNHVTTRLVQPLPEHTGLQTAASYTVL